MKLNILLVFVLIAGCTEKKSTTATPQAGPKSCADYTSPDACVRDGKCTTEYGEDAATAEEFFMACLPVYPINPDCYSKRACYTNSSGQRAIARTCDYPNWTEVECTAAELAPCKYTTATECEADKRCQLNRAKDLATQEIIPMGCGYIRDLCANALACYINRLTGARAMANSICQTPFPEWESTQCTEADYEARKTR